MGCKSHVQKSLNNVEGVTNAEVNLENGEARIEMQEQVPVEDLQAAISKGGGNYQISNS